MLARLNVAGGNIRNIALNAAFLAADAGKPVRMAHLLHAARSEYAKLEKPLTDRESRDGADPMNIELEIDELVLHGVAPKDRAPIGDAVRRELARLLGERGVPHPLQRGGEASVPHGGAVHLRNDAASSLVGQQVAAAVYGSLGTM